MSLKKQVLEKLNKIKEFNRPDGSYHQDIDRIASELIELFSKGDVILMEEVVCKCEDCKKKREGWQL